MEWGIVPSEMLRRVSSWRDPPGQIEALNRVASMLRTGASREKLLRNPELSIDVTERLVVPHLGGPAGNAALAIVEVLADILAHSLSVCYPTLLPALVGVWGDPRLDLRTAATRTIHSLATHCHDAPHQVVPCVVRFLDTPRYPSQPPPPSALMHIREEAVNFFVHILLTRPPPSLSHDSCLPLLHLVKEAVVDAKPRVQFAAVEAFAVMKSLYGSEVSAELDSLRASGRSDVCDILEERFSDSGALPVARGRGGLHRPILGGILPSNGIDAEEKINLWLPCPEGGGLPAGGQPNGFPEVPAVKPTGVSRGSDGRKPSASQGDLELVSVSSTASSYGRRRRSSDTNPRELGGSAGSPLASGGAGGGGLSPSCSLLDSASSGSDRLSLLRSKQRGTRNASQAGKPPPVPPSHASLLPQASLPVEQTHFSYDNLPSRGTDPLCGSNPSSNSAGVFRLKQKRSVTGTATTLQGAGKGQPGGAEGSGSAGGAGAPETSTPDVNGLIISATSSSRDLKSMAEGGAGGGGGGGGGGGVGRAVEECGDDGGDEERLVPLRDAEERLVEAVGFMRGTDWKDHCKGLGVVRAAAVHHTALLQHHLMQVVPLLVQSTDNLRSAIAKAAIKSISTVLGAVRKGCDRLLELIVVQLVRKATESNHFIAEQAELCIAAAVEHCTRHKVLIALLTAAGHKSAKNRSKATKSIHLCCTKLGASVFASKEISRLLQYLHKCLGEGCFEVRYWGRQCLALLHAAAGCDGEFDRSLARAGLGSKQVDKVHDAIAKAEKSDLPPAAYTLSRVTITPALSRGGAGLDSTLASQPEPHQPLVALTQGLGEGDWKERTERLQQLRDTIPAQRGAVAAGFPMLADALVPRLADQNQRVVVLAVQALNDAMCLCEGRRQLPTHTVGQVVAALVPALSGSQSSAVKEAQNAVSNLLRRADSVDVLAGVASALGSVASPRAKVFLLGALHSACAPAHACNPASLQTHVLPLSMRLLSDPRADVRQGNHALIAHVHSLIGDGVFACAKSLPANDCQKLHDLLAA